MWNRRGLLALMLAGPALQACATTVGRSQPSNGPQVALTDVLNQIKYDLGTYLRAHSQDPLHIYQWQADVIADAAASAEADAHDKTLAARPRIIVEEGPECRTSVNFDVVKIELHITTTADVKDVVDGGLEVPFGLVTLAPVAQDVSSTSASQTLKLTIIPDYRAPASPARTPPAAFDGQTPIATTLERMRTSILQVDPQPPCFSFQENEVVNQTLEWGFTTVQSTKVGGKLALALFAIGAETTRSQTVANKIIVTFQDPLGGYG